MKKDITVSIMPTYMCNNNCYYCYLERSVRETRQAPLNRLTLKRRLEEIQRNYNISTVEVYGGDLSLLPPSYLSELINTYSKYIEDKDCAHFTMSDVGLALALGIKERNVNVSINPERLDFIVALNTIKKYPRVGAISVVTSRLLECPIDYVFKWFTNFRGELTLMPYNNYSPGAIVDYVSNYEYCSFVINFMQYYLNNRDKAKFKLTNITMLQDCIRGIYNPSMRNNIFITPSGDFACVDFDDRGYEYFHTFNTLDKWASRCSQEDIDRASRCGICENFHCCMAEHFKRDDQIRNWEKFHGDICNGYKSLITWAKENLRGFSY